MRRLNKSFVIYIGHHGDAGAHRADVILPSAAYTEKSATYVNLEGRTQRTQLATLPVGEAKEDWSIVRALSGELNATLPFDNLEELRNQMIKDTPSLGNIDEITPTAWGDFEVSKSMGGGAFVNPINNFFMTDPISRAALTMAACTHTQNKEILAKANNND